MNIRVFDVARELYDELGPRSFRAAGTVKGAICSCPTPEPSWEYCCPRKKFWTYVEWVLDVHRYGDSMNVDERHTQPDPATRSLSAQEEVLAAALVGDDV